MCLLLAAHDLHPDYRLIIAANRDEFYDRSAAPADYWIHHSRILGGRDLVGGGSWLAVNRAGRFAAVTNVRTSTNVVAPRSRGLIVKDYLLSETDATAFNESLAAEGKNYQGFNLLVADPATLSWYSNQQQRPRSLAAGVYGLSNSQLDTPWPKVTRIKSDFIKAQSLSQQELVAALFQSLENEDPARDEELPNTGIGLQSERVLAPIFIAGDNYGTRCSTIVLISRAGILTFIERRFGPRKTFIAETSFEFEIEGGKT